MRARGLCVHYRSGSVCGGGSFRDGVVRILYTVPGGKEEEEEVDVRAV